MKIGHLKMFIFSSFWFLNSSFKKKNVEKREISRFCGQLKMLLSSGVPLLQSLSIVSNILKGKQYEEIIQRITDGESLAAAMKESFPPMVASSIEGAERVGNLEEVLGRLTKYYEDRAENEDKIKSSLMYPAFVILLCFLSLIVLFTFVLPGFKGMFADLQIELPLFTRIIIGTGDLFSSAWKSLLMALILFLVFVLKYKKTGKIDVWLLKINFISKDQIINSFRMLGSLLNGGISILDALKTTTNSIRNRAFKQIIIDIQDDVENGEKVSQSLLKNNIFPQETVQMIAVGESSGKLGEMLLNISSFYEKERELFIKRFTSMLEPALTLFVGIIVGVIAISMFLPMINMISNLQ
ncbi:MAG: type II secretion system F family protein [Candidatus Margulisiibacteriota bacterium]|nr:type II secretion system F family protein [Candidatus Margulisiibacteriota bacterium]